MRPICWQHWLSQSPQQLFQLLDVLSTFFVLGIDRVFPDQHCDDHHIYVAINLGAGPLVEKSLAVGMQMSNNLKVPKHILSAANPESGNPLRPPFYPWPYMLQMQRKWNLVKAGINVMKSRLSAETRSRSTPSQAVRLLVGNGSEGHLRQYFSANPDCAAPYPPTSHVAVNDYSLPMEVDTRCPL